MVVRAAAEQVLIIQLPFLVVQLLLVVKVITAEQVESTQQQDAYQVAVAEEQEQLVKLRQIVTTAEQAAQDLQILIAEHQ
jgi:choline-glycine betaine transporter